MASWEGKIISKMVTRHKHQDPQDSIHLFISCKHIENLLCAQILGMRCWRQDVVLRELVVVYMCTHMYTHIHPVAVNILPHVGLSPLLPPARATPCRRALTAATIPAHGNPSVLAFNSIFDCKWAHMTSLIRGHLESSCCCCSGAKSCATLCDPLDCSMPGFPVLHYLLEFAQTHVCWVGDAIHLVLCCPLLLLSSIFPSIRVFSKESVLHIKWPKYWSFIVSPSNEYSGLISFRTD